jgi:hypothetical protein
VACVTLHVTILTVLNTDLLDEYKFGCARRLFLPFMETESVLFGLQEPPPPGKYYCPQFIKNKFKTNFNITFPFMQRISKCSHHFRFTVSDFVSISFPAHTSYMSHPLFFSSSS